MTHKKKFKLDSGTSLSGLSGGKVTHMPTKNIALQVAGIKGSDKEGRRYFWQGASGYYKRLIAGFFCFPGHRMFPPVLNLNVALILI